MHADHLYGLTFVVLLGIIHFLPNLVNMFKGVKFFKLLGGVMNSFVGRVMVFFLSGFFVLGLSPSLYAKSSVEDDQKFEQEVLEILKNNKELLLELVEKAHQEKEQARQEELENKTVDPNLDDAIYFAGDQNSDNQILSYFSFSCPHCKDVHYKISEITSQNDSIGFAIKPIPLNEFDNVVTQFFLALAEQDIEVAKTFQNWIFENTEEVFDDQSLIDNYLADLVESEGIDQEQFEAFLDNKKANEILNSYVDEFTGHEFEGLPVTIVNQRVVTGSRNSEAFTKFLDL